MNALRLSIASLVALGVALGCNGLLGIDDGASAPPPADLPDGTAGDEGPGLEGGPKPNDDGGADGAIPKNDAGNDLLADGLNGAVSLVQDDDNLYWVSNGDVMTVPKSGAAKPRTLVNIVGAVLVAVDPGSGAAGNVYVATGQQITWHPKTTGTTGTVITLAGGRNVASLASDGTSVFFLDYNEGSDVTLAKRVPKNGGAPTTFTGPNKVLALGVRTDWAAFIDHPNGDQDRRVHELVPPSANVPTPRTTAIGYTVDVLGRPLTLDATHAYWLDDQSVGPPYVLRTQARGATSAQDIATFSLAEEPAYVAVDAAKAAYVIIKTSTAGTDFVGDVVKVKLGAARAPIVGGLVNPSGVVVAGGFLYVSEDKGGSKADIQKVALP